MRNRILAACAAVMALAWGSAHAQDPFKIGYLVDGSGPAQGVFSPTLEGFRLYVDTVNASGGVGGRKIDLQVRDVQVDTQRSTVAAQELASSGAIAIVGLSLSSTHMPVYTAMSKEKVPVVAGFPSNVGAVLPPTAREGFYGIGLAWELTGEVGGVLAKQAVPSAKSFVCVTFESPGGLVACDSALAGAKGSGFDKVEKVTFPLQQRDFRAVAERIKQLNPDVVVALTCRGRTLPLLTALSATEYAGAFLSSECGTGDDELLEAMKSAPKYSLYSYTRYLGGGQGRGAQLDALTNAAKKAGIANVMPFHSAGWVLGMVVADGLKNCGSPCTGEKLNAALAKTSLDTGGLTGAPIKYAPGDHYGESAYQLLRVDAQASRLVPVGGWLKVKSVPQHYRPAK